jgi:PIN domain nuclease of toxin-antitoxin system
MKLQIIDTHVLLWFLHNDPKLPKKAKNLIESDSYTSGISMASLWEISIKNSIGKLQFQYANNANLPSLLMENGFQILNIEWRSIRKAGELPWIHRDPFDRLIIAESLLRNAPVISVDSKFDAYGIRRIGI